MRLAQTERRTHFRVLWAISGVGGSAGVSFLRLNFRKRPIAGLLGIRWASQECLLRPAPAESYVRNLSTSLSGFQG